VRLAILRKHLSYANVVATMALFVALGGASYAAITLPRNSVGPKQIKRNAVNGKKVKNRSLSGLDINLAKLGKVPSSANADHATAADHATVADGATSAGHATTADSATTAGTATNIAPPEAWHEVGTPGEPPFETGAGNELPPGPGVLFEKAGFYKDREGVVHLKGMVHGTGDGFFRLPPGYRPAEITVIFLPAVCRDCGSTLPDAMQLAIQGGGFNADRDGMVAGGGTASQHVFSLDGVTFRAAG
jgi:hypothetical protein